MLFYINVGCIGLKVQIHFSQDVLFISCHIFYEVIKVKPKVKTCFIKC